MREKRIGRQTQSLKVNHMKSPKTVPVSVDDYIGNCPKEVQTILKNIRKTVKEAAPAAEEKISYQMPTYIFKGRLIYFAAFKAHIGFFPLPSAIQKFKKELSQYQTAKGTVRFPLDKTIPYSLIARIVKFRVRENLERFRMKKKTE